jgi:hypothetical protein
MSRAPTDVAQSFTLRFWREPRRGTCQQWRGQVWHEQQKHDEKPTSVADPEEAFEIVRRNLYRTCSMETLEGQTKGLPIRRFFRRLLQYPRRLSALCRKLRPQP